MGEHALERSRALGASSGHVMSRHIMPNVSPLILANVTLTVPVARHVWTSQPAPRTNRSWSAPRSMTRAVALATAAPGVKA